MYKWIQQLIAVQFKYLHFFLVIHLQRRNGLLPVSVLTRRWQVSKIFTQARTFAVNCLGLQPSIWQNNKNPIGRSGDRSVYRES